MNILFLGDIVGRPGRHTVRDLLPSIVREHAIDFVIANAENIAGGVGATPALVEEMRSYGIDLFTLGNHTWRKREMVSGIDALPTIARPANYPPSAPGAGTAVHRFPDGTCLAVINLIGRIFMEPVDCPFLQASRELEALPPETTYIIVDMHAEATSEKAAMAWHLDGRCTAVIGTHTHVQTADERVLPKGTAFISDAGMCGPYNSILGVEKERVIEKLITGIPLKWEVATGPTQLNGVIIEAAPSGKARSIRRIRKVEHQ